MTIEGPPPPHAANPEAPRPRSLLVIRTHPGHGGVANFSLWLRDLLIARGHEVHFLCLYGDGGTPEVPTLLPAPPRGAADYGRMFVRCWRHLRRLRPDAVHGLMPLASVMGALAGLLAGCPSRVAGQHQVGYIVQPIMKRLDGWCGTLGVYTGSVACSKTVRDSLTSPGSRYWRRSTVIYNTLPPPPRAEGISVHSRIGVAGDAFVIGCIGALTARKNQMLLVDVLPHLEDTHLVLIGDGEDAARLAARSRELRVADRCHLLGQLPPAEAQALLTTFAAFVFPSLGEGFPLVLLEAMRAGVAIVASDLPMNVEALQGEDDTATGFVVPVTAPEHWIETLEKLRRDPDARARLGRAAASRYERFSPEAMADAYERAFFAPWPDTAELYIL